jgi:hypothetical protein
MRLSRRLVFARDSVAEVDLLLTPVGTPKVPTGVLVLERHGHVTGVITQRITFTLDIESR